MKESMKINTNPYIEETYRKWLDFLKNKDFDYTNFDTIFNSKEYSKSAQEKDHQKVFVFDGIIDKKVWDKQKPKIMFLLRESYDWYNIIKGIKPRNGKNSHFFPNILRYKLIIEELYNKEKPNFDLLDSNHKHTPEWQQNSLNTIAYFDIKKFLGTKTSTYSDIIKTALTYKDLLREHIDLIDPDVIYCDNITYNAYKKIYEIDYEKSKSETFFDPNLKSNKKKLPKLYKHNDDFSGTHRNRLLVRFYHPSYFKNDSTEKLITGVKSINNDKEVNININKLFKV